ncbi:MAG: class I SAM-dependent methyltransferase family protein [Euryarchaeota archaeon]|nr:class I SAM-dependent methyltransferase family protein [Euryarchaeota archaeon]
MMPREVLRGKLSEEELRHVRRRYEVIGDIAIIDVPAEIEHRKMVIANTLTYLQNINVVLQKIGDVHGENRIRDYDLLLGDRTETIHKENGYRFKLDPTKVYFTGELASERKRVLDQVRNGETILCTFAGIGPYPIAIAKHRDVRIYAIEINPIAYRYMNENLELNKVADKICAICGDVRDVVPSIGECFDRIIMPTPIGDDFLDLDLDFLKKVGW